MSGATSTTRGPPHDPRRHAPRDERLSETIEIVCLPLAIPDKVVIDITNLELHETIQIADVILPEGVKAVYDNNYAVLGVITTVAEAAPGEGA